MKEKIKIIKEKLFSLFRKMGFNVHEEVALDPFLILGGLSATIIFYYVSIKSVLIGMADFIVLFLNCLCIIKVIMVSLQRCSDINRKYKRAKVCAIKYAPNRYYSKVAQVCTIYIAVVVCYYLLFVKNVNQTACLTKGLTILAFVIMLGVEGMQALIDLYRFDTDPTKAPADSPQ